MIGRLFRKLTSPKVENAEPLATPVVVSEAERKKILLLAGEALANGQHDQAHIYVQPLLQANKDDCDALQIEGIWCNIKGLYRESAAILEHAIELGAQGTKVWEFLVGSLMNAGMDSAALAAVQKAGNVFSANRSSSFLGMLYMRMERFEEAAKALNDAVIAAPKDYESLGILVQFDYTSRVILKRYALTDKAEHIRCQVRRRLMADRLKKPLAEEQARFLIEITMNDPDYFYVALEEANRLYQMDMLEDATANTMSDIFLRTGDVKRTMAVQAQALDAKLALNQEGANYAHGFVRVSAGGKLWQEGWRMMNKGVRKIYKSHIVNSVRQWEGERLRNTPLFINQDQGHGDMLLAVRLVRIYVERGGKAVLWVRPEIRELFDSVTGIGTVVTTPNIGWNKPDAKAFGCEVSAPIFSLISLLDVKPEEFKKPVLLQAPAGRCEAWREKLRQEKRVRVGFVTTGNPWRADDWFRSVFAKDLQCLKTLENVAWVNLAADKRAERDELMSMLDMLNPMEDVKDFSDTAAIIDMLDVVVAIDCSVAHLAGALGKPVLALISPTLDWRWKVGDDEHPVWPTVDTFRGTMPGVWDAPVARLFSALQEIVKKTAERR